MQQPRWNSSTSRSPMKRQLAKRIVTYFDQLEEIKNPKDKGSERKRSHSKSNSKKTQFEIEKGIEVYESEETKMKKLEDLKDLMKRELLQAKVEGATDIQPDIIYKSVKGYPSFMKNYKTPEPLRKKPTYETDLNAFKKSVHQELEERVAIVEGKSVTNIEPAEILDGRTMPLGIADPYDEPLYSLETQKHPPILNTSDEQSFDFHQRKSKEIRRLQYASELKQRSGSKDRDVRESSDRDSRTLRNITNGDRSGYHDTGSKAKGKENRTRPEEGYPVWVRFIENGKRKVIPAVLTHAHGFRINPNSNTMEVVEKDQVSVSPYDQAPRHQQFVVFQGRVERPNVSRFVTEDECELVVQDREGNRYPILFYERDKNADDALNQSGQFQAPVRGKNLHESNCRIFDEKGKLIGRGRAILKPAYSQGVLITPQEKLVPVVASLTSKTIVVVKTSPGTSSKFKILESEVFEVSGHRINCLTIASLENDKQSPDLLFLEESSSKGGLFQDNLLQGEHVVCEIDDSSVIEGILNIDTKQREMWVSMVPFEHSMHDTLTKAVSERGVRSSRQSHSFKGERVKIDLDDKDRDGAVQDLIEKVKSLLDGRKGGKPTRSKRTSQASNGIAVGSSAVHLNFTVVTPDGQQLRIYVRPKGTSAEQLDQEVDAEFGPPTYSAELITMKSGQDIYAPDGIRVPKLDFQEDLQTSEVEIRVVQFVPQEQTLENAQEELERLKDAEDFAHEKVLDEEGKVSEERKRLSTLNADIDKIHKLEENCEREGDMIAARLLKEQEDELKREREEEERRLAAEEQRLKEAKEEEDRLRREEEKLRRQIEEEDRLRRQIEEEEEEARRAEALRREEEDRIRRELEAEEERMAFQEEEKNRKLREIEETERKVQELREALSRTSSHQGNHFQNTVHRHDRIMRDSLDPLPRVEMSRYTRVELNMDGGNEDIAFVGYGEVISRRVAITNPTPPNRTMNQKHMYTPNTQAGFTPSSTRYQGPSDFGRDNYMQSPNPQIRDSHRMSSNKKAQEILKEPQPPSSVRDSRQVIATISKNKDSTTQAPSKTPNSTSSKVAANKPKEAPKRQPTIAEQADAAQKIQTIWRYRDFKAQLKLSKDYQTVLAKRYSVQSLYDKYLSFVKSLPQPVYGPKTIQSFLSTLASFLRD
jgi:hypothetical protein